MYGFLAGAGLSLLSNIYQNKAIESTANTNYENAVALAEREAVAQRSQLMVQAREQSIAVNQERYNLQREAMRERATESVQTAEGGFGGVLAKRLQTATDLSESQEGANIDINEELQDEARQAQAYGVAQGKVDRIGNARLARHNALQGRASGLSMVTGAVAGGAQGSKIGSALGIGATAVKSVDLATSDTFDDINSPSSNRNLGQA